MHSWAHGRLLVIAYSFVAQFLHKYTSFGDQDFRWRPYSVQWMRLTTRHGALDGPLRTLFWCNWNRPWFFWRQSNMEGDFIERMLMWDVHVDMWSSGPWKTRRKIIPGTGKAYSESFNPKPSEIVQNYKYNNRFRNEGESVANSVAALKILGEHCENGNTLETILRDRMCGIRDENIQRRLLVEGMWHT